MFLQTFGNSGLLLQSLDASTQLVVALGSGGRFSVNAASEVGITALPRIRLLLNCGSIGVDKCQHFGFGAADQKLKTVPIIGAVADLCLPKIRDEADLA